jgi:hypothetical protein
MREDRQALGWGLVAVIAIVALIVIGGIVNLIGWQVGWWYQTQNVTRQAHLVQNNFATQEGYISAISNDVANLDGVVAQEGGNPPNLQALRVEALGIGNQACLEASYLTGSVPLQPTMATWIKVNCSAGTVSLTSPLRNGTGN